MAVSRQEGVDTCLMQKVEFDDIVGRKLYGAYGMMRYTDEQNLWFEQLKDFQADVVNAAITDYISVNTRRPTPADIIGECKRIISTRRSMDNYRNERLVSCPFCHDRGLIVTKTPMGIWNGRPCTECGKGREKYPWYFLTDEEKEKAMKEEERQGLKPPRSVFSASKEFYNWYNYGTEYK